MPSTVFRLHRLELRRLLHVAAPIMMSSMFSFLMTLVDLYFVGSLGKEPLAAATVGNVWFNTLLYPILGCATALDTLLAQSHGAGQPDAYARWTQVGLLVLGLLCVPFMIMLALTEPILLATGMNATLAANAAEFDGQLILGVVPFVLFTALTKYLQSQGILYPSVAIAAVANVFNGLANYLLIEACGLGLRGAPLATSLCRWVQLAIMLVYLRHARERLAPTLPRLKIEWREMPSSSVRFLRLGGPGALMLGLEAWAFEVSTFLAAFLGTVALDAHSILMNLIAFSFMSGPFSLGIAASLRVGQLVGAGETSAARATARVAIAFILSYMSLTSAFLIGSHSWIGLLFTADVHVVAQVASLAGVAALFQFADGAQAAIGGILRGLGRQRTVAALNLAGFWLIGLPVGASLTFGAHLGVVGLWWGLATGLTAVAIVGVPLLARIDWDAEAKAALARVGRDGGGGGGGDGGDGDGGGGGGGGLASADAQREQVELDTL